MNAFKKLTAKQHVAALRSTADRYMRGMMAFSTFNRHMRYLWARVEQSPAMKRRVCALLRQTQFVESSTTAPAVEKRLILIGGAR